MNLLLDTRNGRAYSRAALALICVALAGCDRDDIRVYRLAKNPPAAPMVSTATLPAGHPELGGSTRPGISWQTPAGWTEGPAGEMRVGSFKISGKDGRQADVSVIPLGGAAGGDVANVNRWRGQVGMEPLPADQIRTLAQGIEIAGQPGELYELAGTNPGSGEPMEILAAILNRDGTAWFFKMTGDAPLVADQKAAFLEFLKSVRFEPGAAAGLPPSHPPVNGMSLPAGHPEISGMSAADAGAEAGKPDWQVPAGWQAAAAGQFLIAKFMIPGEGGASAAVNVSASAGDGGGLVANVNRWRKQLGLAEETGDAINKSTAALDLAGGGKATVVELLGTDPRTGQPAKLVGVLVPQAGQTWFYKLMGEEKVVETQKDAFTKFVQTVKY